MSGAKKVTIVLGGYVAAIAAAAAAAWLYNWHTSRLPYDTSGGMYAAGEAMTSVAVFLVVALVPTVLALWYLRGNTQFWNVVGWGSLLFAGVSLLSVLIVMVYPAVTRSLVLAALNLLALSQLLGVPFWFASFVLFAFLAPDRRSRRLLQGAVAIELVIGVCAALHWFAPGSGF